MKYFGHLVTADGTSTDEDKIRAVKDWPRPQNDYAHITDASMSSPRK